MTEKQEQIDLSSWDDFTGDFIKPDIIKEFPVTIVPVKIEAVKEEDKKPQIIITFLYNKRNWKMNINRTNQNFIRSRNMTPKEIIGKKLKFDKIKARNPTSNQMVDSFSLIDIQNA